MPPLAVPSSLVRAMPVDVGGLAEQQRLAQAVLAGGGVDGQQRLVRRAGELALDDLAHLGQLVHQVLLGVQAAGGVHDHHVGAACGGGLQGVEDHRRRVRALGPADQLHVGALGPDLQLLGGGRAVGVARGQQHRAARAPCCRCQAILPIVVVLPVPLTPTTRITVGLAVSGIVSPGQRGGLGQQLAQAVGQVLPALQVARRGLALQALDDLRPWWARPRRRRSASPPGARRPPRPATRTSWPGARPPAPGGSWTCSRAGGGRSPPRWGSSPTPPARLAGTSSTANSSCQVRATRGA